MRRGHNVCGATVGRYMEHGQRIFQRFGAVINAIQAPRVGFILREEQCRRVIAIEPAPTEFVMIERDD